MTSQVKLEEISSRIAVLKAAGGNLSAADYGLIESLLDEVRDEIGQLNVVSQMKWRWALEKVSEPARFVVFDTNTCEPLGEGSSPFEAVSNAISRPANPAQQRYMPKYAWNLVVQIASLRSEILEVREPVRQFGKLMEHKLKAHDGKCGWKHLTLEDLYQMMLKETKDLRDVLDSNDPNAIRFECADVANFAMMIADNLPTVGLSDTEEDE